MKEGSLTKKVAHILSNSPWSPFSSGFKLFLLALGLGAVIAFLYGRRNLADNTAWSKFFNSFSVSFIEDVVFFTIFTFGLLLIARKSELASKAKSLFATLRETPDFNCDDSIRNAYEQTLYKLGAYNDELRIRVDIRELDFENMRCKVDVEIACKMTNISKSSDYEDVVKSIHFPRGHVSREECQIIAAAQAPTLEDLDASERSIRPEEVQHTDDGSLIFERHVPIPAGQTCWMRTRYEYIWPIRDPIVPTWKCEEHSFTSSRITNVMMLDVRKVASERCRVTIESTREGQECSVILEPSDSAIHRLLTLRTVQPNDTGAIQVYVEKPEPTEVT